MTTFLQVSDNSKTRALDGSLANITSPITLSGIDTTSFDAITTGYIVTIWDDTTYTDPGDDPNMEKAFVGTATIDIEGSLTLTRNSPLTHSGTPCIALLAIARHISDLNTAVNNAETNITSNATAISSETTRATTAEDLKANTADLATVATTGSYDDLSDKPTLGTAAAENTGYFATAAQGTLADTATQPEDLATVATTGAYSDLSGNPTIPDELADLTDDTTHRLVTDTQISSWDSKQGSLGYTAEDVANKGTANGYAELDETGKVPSAQLPSFVDDVIDAADFAALPVTGESAKIYITIDDNKTYRWSGTDYAEISASLALGEISTTAYRGDRGKTAYDHSQLISSNPHNVTKTDVGLGSVDDTTDLDKPISTATQSALDNKQDTGAYLTAETDPVFTASEAASFAAGDKTKLDGIATGAEVNVNADWNSVNGDSQILNKPTLGTAATAATTDFAPALGIDDNYVTDAEKIVIGNTSGTNSGDNAVNSNYSSLTQYTDELAQDAVGGILNNTGNVQFTYDDATPKITATVDLSSKQDALGFTAEDVANKSTTTTLGTSDTLYPTQNAVKTYVDNLFAGFSPKSSCKVATTANLNAAYLNGSSGVGATLVNAGSLAALSIDGVSLSTSDRVLVKNQTTVAHNGIYTVTTVGSGVIAWVLTRAIDYDQTTEISEGTYTLIEEGTANAETLWQMITAGTITVGTTDIAFAELLVAPQDHGVLTGLSDDDHTQYHNDTRGDARYALLAKGVTNGDSHDHSGGDGAQINHTTLSNIGTNTHAQIDTHLASTSNPHSVTKAQVGLTNADDTADIDKPVSTDQQTALDLKANLISPSFTTPALGVATATSVNGILSTSSTITAPAGLTIAGSANGSGNAILRTADRAGGNGASPVQLLGGNSSGTDGSGGSVLLNGGSCTSGSDQTGGGVVITAGSALGTRGWGGDINLVAGDGGTSTAEGGDIILKPGTSSGTKGIVKVLNSDNTYSANLNTEALTASRVLTIADAAGTIALTTNPTALSAPNYTSTVATGTQPYACTSTTKNTNLNADLFDGAHLSTDGTFAGNSDTLVPTEKAIQTKLTAQKDVTETLTGKTLTSPKINEAVTLTTTATKLNYLTSATGTTGTASTNLVFSTSPVLVTPALGTPASGVMTNCTGVPIASIVNPYKCRATFAGTFTYTVTNTPYILPLATEVYDPNNNFNTTTYKYTVPITGYYLVSGRLQNASPGDTTLNQIYIIDDATVVLSQFGMNTGGGNSTLLSTASSVYLTAGQTVQLNGSGAATKTCVLAELSVHLLSV